MEKLGDRLRSKGLSDLTSMNVFRGRARFTEGIKSLEDAVEQYKRADSWEKAAKTSEDLVTYYEKHFITGVSIEDAALNRPQFAKYLIEAGDCNDDVDHAKAIVYWDRAALAMKANNNFTGAGLLYKRLAKIEEERQDFKRVIHCWDAAAEAYDGADSSTSE